MNNDVCTYYLSREFIYLTTVLLASEFCFVKTFTLLLLLLISHTYTHTHTHTHIHIHTYTHTHPLCAYFAVALLQNIYVFVATVHIFLFSAYPGFWLTFFSLLSLTVFIAKQPPTNNYAISGKNV